MSTNPERAAYVVINTLTARITDICSNDQTARIAARRWAHALVVEITPADIARLHAAVEPVEGSAVSLTYGDLPAAVRALIVGHEWDNKTPSEQRDWCIAQIVALQPSPAPENKTLDRDWVARATQEGAPDLPVLGAGTGPSPTPKEPPAPPEDADVRKLRKLVTEQRALAGWEVTDRSDARLEQIQEYITRIAERLAGMERVVNVVQHFPRHTHAVGGAYTRHGYYLEAAEVWALDGALTALGVPTTREEQQRLTTPAPEGGTTA